MQSSSLKILALACTLCASAACSQPASNAATANDAEAVSASAPSADAATKSVATDAKAFCAKLQPAVQPLVKIPLSLFKADDSKTDDLHADDASYMSCIYDSQGKRVTVIMRAAGDVVEHDKSNGLTPVSGYGDQAFYSDEKGGGLHWVDVVHGSDSCEALLGVEAGDLASGDFSKTGGQICMAALAAR